jgi:hypothetical protein
VVRVQRGGQGRLNGPGDHRRADQRRLVFFYLRIVVMMYMTPSAESPARFPPCRGWPARRRESSRDVLVFYLGILPDARPALGPPLSIATIF